MKMKKICDNIRVLLGKITKSTKPKFHKDLWAGI